MPRHVFLCAARGMTGSQVAALSSGTSRICDRYAADERTDCGRMRFCPRRCITADPSAQIAPLPGMAFGPGDGPAPTGCSPGCRAECDTRPRVDAAMPEKTTEHFTQRPTFAGGLGCRTGL